ncbi:MAG: hypothetical protein ACX939_14230, partial [Hyphococcus sp.]
DAVSCAVDNGDGAVFLARASGRLIRMATDAPPAEFAAAPIGAAGDLAIALSGAAPNTDSSVSGLVLLLDKTSGAVHAFDRNSGALDGVVTVGESFEIEAVNASTAMTATGANLGGLYRNGVAAFGVDLGEGVGAVRMIPVNGLLNALDRPEAAPSSPRGYMPQTDDDALIIPSVNSPE